jgi:thiol-disulfide isomerase/thioredoxin
MLRRLRDVSTLWVVVFALAVAAAAAAQDKSSDADEQLRNGDAYMQRSQFEQALQAYKRAHALKNKTSYEAVVGMALAYRGLGAHKNVLDACADGLKLAGDDKRRQAQMHNLRGVALVALAGKPNDKKLSEAETEFRTALAADESLVSARLNLGIALLKTGRDPEGIRELKTYVETSTSKAEVEKARRMIEDPRRAREPFAPEFSFTSSDGEYISLEDLAGKTVLLDFWGSWCAPCVAATPGLIKLRRKFAGQPVVFLGIAQDQEDRWKGYLERHHMDWPQYLDTPHRMLRLFNVNTYPTYIILDGEGIVRARRSGFGPGTHGWLEDEIKKTLKESAR